MKGPIDVSRSPHARLQPAAATIEDGYWAGVQRLNREVLLADAPERLEAAGNFHNLRVAAGLQRGEFRGLRFTDSDTYKWLEAVGWETGVAQPEEAIGLIEAAQEPDGYLNTYYQLVRPRERFSNPAEDHELYCCGHLIQAAIAHVRARGDDRLLRVAERFVALLWRRFGPDGEAYTPGHPEIEMALVELSRLTGDARHRQLAQRFVDQRGKGTLQPAVFGSSYFQDRVPVREQRAVEGHAVRALYLNAGVTDLYLETGEAALLDALRAQWRDMASRKTYLTGGLGAHHADEAFGDAYELPPDRCYGETCAAIASVMWNWRMLLATGEARYARLLERTLFNGVMAGLALDGRTYSYVNPLQVRAGHADPVEYGSRRLPWFRCACCPPNVMRLLATLQHYLATTDDTGLQIHQFAGATVRGAGVAVRMRTAYPWDGRVSFEVLETTGEEWTLRARDAAWTRAWAVGDTVELELDMTPRLVHPHPRIDAVRGCVAIERGPLVYCVEGAVDDLRIDARGALRAVEWDGIVAIEASGARAAVADSEWPYGEPATGRVSPQTLLAVPYSHWGNRGDGGMRVWIPLL